MERVQVLVEQLAGRAERVAGSKLKMWQTQSNTNASTRPVRPPSLLVWVTAI